MEHLFKIIIYIVVFVGFFYFLLFKIPEMLWGMFKKIRENKITSDYNKQSKKTDKALAAALKKQGIKSRFR